MRPVCVVCVQRKSNALLQDLTTDLTKTLNKVAKFMQRLRDLKTKKRKVKQQRTTVSENDASRQRYFLAGYPRFFANLGSCD